MPDRYRLPDRYPPPDEAGWATPSPRRRRVRHAGVALLALLGAGALAVWAVAAFLSDHRPFPSQGGPKPALPVTTAQPWSWLGPSAPTPAPASPTATALAPEPAAVTLRVTDLPPGYHVVRSGPAKFSAGAGPAPPAGWDVVFAPDAGTQAGYLLVESAVAVYPDAGTAAAATAAAEGAEGQAQGIQLAPIPGLGDRQSVWLELAPDRAEYGIVRVIWQSLNVVGQVAVLGPVGPSQPQQTVQLAMVEQERIRPAPAPGT